ncbi:magnesium/cobalt transporter CorA [Patescibacteria group bacterium]|nr:magnesium/cobalt transporter CorA [Patescibacteria group bacterium]
MRVKEIKTEKFTWVDVKKPTRQELEKLREKYHFHYLDIDDTLTYTQRPKIEKYDDYLFIILRFPIFDKKERKFNISEVDFFVGQDFFISIHRGDVEPIQKFMSECQSEKIPIEKCVKDPEFLLYSLMKNLFLSYFPIIDHISDDLDEIEDKIFQEQEREMVKEIMVMKRNIIALRRIVGPHRMMMKTLESLNIDFFQREMDIYFSDVNDFVEKTWAVLEDQRETVISLENTNESLISHKSSEIVKTLTIFSAILLPLTLFASIYGMNMTQIPFIFHPQSFWIVLGMMFAFGVGLFFFFRKKKWL